jgi:tetratricopeptide (TPR) repeat protein
MKPSMKFFLVMLALMAVHHCQAQLILTFNVDSLRAALAESKEDTNRVWALNNLGRNIVNSDTTLALADQAIALSKKLKFVKGEAEAYNNIAYWYNMKGDYYKSLENYFTSVKLSESIGYEAGLKRSYNSMGTVYIYLKDYQTALGYSRRSRRLSIKFKDRNTQSLASSWMSRSFIDLHQIDSALKYAQESFELASQLKEPFPLYLATARLGEVNAALLNHSLAIEYLRMSLRFAKQDRRFFRITAAHQQLASEFYSIGEKDSAMFHARQVFDIAQRENLAASLLGSSLLLAELYEKMNTGESLKYHKIARVAQDSLFSQEKNRQIQMLNFSEKLRQQDMEEARQAEAEARKHGLEYAAIAIGLVGFMIVFLLLSHSIIANERLIRFLGILALLIVFEFVNLLLHPFIGNFTHHSPLWMLGFMVILAALLIPLHHKLEKVIVHRLIEKNKKIKLAAAKKIISSMEGEV